MFEKEIIIDARGHLLGRLASVVAKELLNGQSIVLVRCEDINISGSLYRNRLKYMEFLRKKTNSNPRDGPFHYRAPSKIIWRTIRGMMPHKTARGQMALARLRCFEGVPAPYDMKKRMVVPQALKVLRLKLHRKFCRLGDLSSRVGWNHDDLIKRLETRRKVRAEAYYKVTEEERKKKEEAAKAVASELPAADRELLAAVGSI
uniref:Ribosomal protein L13a n=1 Tax=Chromera velia CCMP2878 TaxID=1169474 RepID=A0A0G4HLK1_9ALVE|eukprot:Cvel_28977.t1-p1 / transcript=Cvel_28977.t1 / gene=Cvel_28977 / organism=Chromera_velia_CCMP2878 / gene_product=60S ribosomal protein L13a, putative / transcript_product=60S ribosomal protein L13a, putative / location=Cvel_scaffold3893:9372-11769(+) / protein_length=202 / sequence_SO=supercontig / SO=protein_coding / is_pseudo=false